MKAIKLTIAIFTFLLFHQAQAQNAGFSYTRGFSGVYPNRTMLNRSLTTAMSMGFTHTAELKNDLGLQLGLAINMCNSTNNIKPNSNSSYIRIPRSFYSVELPFVLEKTYKENKNSLNYYRLLAGAQVMFQWHEKEFRKFSENSTNRTLNKGITLAFQWAKKESENLEFFVGPQVKILSTGLESTPVMGFYGLRMDWRIKS